MREVKRRRRRGRRRRYGRGCATRAVSRNFAESTTRATRPDSLSPDFLFSCRPRANPGPPEMRFARHMGLRSGDFGEGGDLHMRCACSVDDAKGIAKIFFLGAGELGGDGRHGGGTPPVCFGVFWTLLDAPLPDRHGGKVGTTAEDGWLCAKTGANVRDRVEGSDVTTGGQQEGTKKPAAERTGWRPAAARGGAFYSWQYSGAKSRQYGARLAPRPHNSHAVPPLRRADR